MHNNTFLKRCFSMYLAFHTHVNSTGTPDTFLQKINSQHIQKRITYGWAIADIFGMDDADNCNVFGCTLVSIHYINNKIPPHVAHLLLGQHYSRIM